MLFVYDVKYYVYSGRLIVFWFCYDFTVTEIKTNKYWSNLFSMIHIFTYRGDRKNAEDPLVTFFFHIIPACWVIAEQFDLCVRTRHRTRTNNYFCSVSFVPWLQVFLEDPMTFWCKMRYVILRAYSGYAPGSPYSCLKYPYRDVFRLHRCLKPAQRAAVNMREQCFCSDLLLDIKASPRALGWHSMK